MAVLTAARATTAVPTEALTAARVTTVAPTPARAATVAPMVVPTAARAVALDPVAATAARTVALTAVPTVERAVGPTAVPMAVRVGEQPLSAGRSPDRPALRRCISAEPGEFASVHWGRAPLLSKAADLAKPFDDLLTLTDVDELLSRRGLRSPFLRVARDGAVLGSWQFTRGGGVGAEIADQVADDKVTRLFDDGSTLVLQALHRLWPPLIDFGGGLGVDLGHPVQINAYITPPSSRGFSAHYDVHDVFVLQLDGRKRWLIHAPVHPDPLRDQPWDRRRAAVEARAAEEPLIDTALEPGDALYLPRGYLHSATALGGVSAHLTVGVHVLTRYAIVEALLKLAGGLPELRATLPLGIDAADPDQLAPHIAEVVAELGRLAPDSGAVARVLRDLVWQGTRPSPVSPLAQVAAARAVAAGTRVKVRPGLRFRLDARDGRVLLDIPGDQLSLPETTAAALAELLSGEPCVVGRIGGLPVADQIVLVRRLLREAILVPMGDVV
ncbi:cupin domain-containing protein [Alloactinosynnema sp. L-07]|uniref:cupin domain-containing protein n=1 Tax=Alloactinosynnema sp. L-07 TaxID=1653480 RepID=UPI000A9DF77A|nr:cupin domain-containing protein [Alloactinosynnema sp. L-07]